MVISGTGPRPGMTGGYGKRLRLATEEGGMARPAEQGATGGWVHQDVLTPPGGGAPPPSSLVLGGVWARLARGAQKPFHVIQKTAETSLGPALPHGRLGAPRMASLLKVPLSQSAHPGLAEKRRNSAC